MYYFLSLLIGVVISFMIAANGDLNAAIGLHSSTVVIHVVGLTVVSIFLIVKKINPFKNRQPWYLYTAGVMGVLATAGNSYAFEPLGVSAILALGLLGQTVTGIIVDHFGLFGMNVYKFKKKRVFGFLIMLVGIVFMIRKFELLAVILSFSTGGVLVLQRAVNGSLSAKTNIATSTIFTYIVGLGLSLVVLMFFGQGEAMLVEKALPSGVWIYMGGAFGAITVFLSTVCVSKIPAYGLSVLIFVGQVFTGVAIDSYLTGSLTTVNLIGGVIVSIGLCVELALAKKA